MSDIIQVLPDSVANQIAAGEVIQRPASVVKELMENSVDAKSTSVKLVIKDAGRTLIQVIDNGSGMSETDARLCFERHATSKIRKADDLFAIYTKGFRGEALASIAAIAHVELKTKRENDELGTVVEIEGSTVNQQEPCSHPEGSSIAVKNLFFNVPARRNFLKSHAVETRHIIDAFQHIALPHPNIEFAMNHHENEVFRLGKGSLRQRIMGIFGSNYNQKLVPVEEETNIVKISGYIGKPEFAKKTRGEQFFFVNRRYIKNAYLNHAVLKAYEEVLPNNYFPLYVLLLEIDPKTIDINIHPTKTEVKFEDEKAIYAVIRSAIRQSLGKYNIAPSLDFEREKAVDIALTNGDREIKAPTIRVNPDYNPFLDPGGKEGLRPSPGPSALQKHNLENWEKLYSEHGQLKSTIEKRKIDFEIELQQVIDPDWKSAELAEDQSGEGDNKRCYQFHKKYIITQIKSGCMIIDQQGAHERILYEQFLDANDNNKGASQQLIFPQTVKLSASDFELLKELEDGVISLGFDISDCGKNAYVINGIPSGCENEEAIGLLEGLLEQYKTNAAGLTLDKRENLAQSLSCNMSIKSGKTLLQEEMSALIDQLFSCKMPYVSPSGRPTITTLTTEDLDKRFQK